jgi:excisionase family DNA binding protein
MGIAKGGDLTMHQELLTIKEAAQILRIHWHTVYEWVYLKKIPYVKFGRVIRIPRDELEKLIETHTVRPENIQHLRAIRG